MAEAASALVGAARRLRPLDPRAARDALLSALEAAVFAGWAPSGALLQEIARTARDLPPTGDPPDSAANLLLQGYTTRVTGGYAAAVPALRRRSRPSSRMTWTPTSPSDDWNWPPSRQPICWTTLRWSG